MSDFVDEVEGRLRADQAQALARRLWPFVAGVVALALIATLAVWGWSRAQAGAAAKASDAYGAGVEALTKGDVTTAEARFGQVARSAPRGYRALALMQQAGLRLTAHKDAEAVDLLDQAAGAAPNQVLGDAARMKAALVLMDDKPLTAVEPRLTLLAGENRPYRLVAREALGMEHLAAGQTASARGDFAIVSLSQDASEAARTRARAAIRLMDDGIAPRLPALVKAAAALPDASASLLSPASLQAPEAPASSPAQSSAQSPVAGAAQ